MAFDRTKPVNGTTVDADLLRGNLNDLDDRVSDIVLLPGPPGPQGIQGPPGNDGNDGPQGPTGPPLASPLLTTAVLDAPVHLGAQELKFDTTRDIGGSSEALAGLSAADGGEGPLLQVRCRTSGADRFLHRLDLGGMIAGGGMPSVNHGDLLRFDAAAQTWKPVTGTTEDIEVKDSADNISTLHFVNGLYVGRTTGP